MSQPYQALGDSNWYTRAPGQSSGGFTAGGGWTLTGGASFVSTKLSDGSLKTVINLPYGSTAVSPAMCVDSQFPSARVSVLGGANGPGMQVYVGYSGGTSQSSGVVNGASTWGASRAFQLHAGSLSGWQLAQYTFKGAQGGVQMYDFWVDPRSMH